MGIQSMAVDISAETYAAAERIAERDHVPVGVLIENLVKRHVDYIASLEFHTDIPAFTLDAYDMMRDPGETDEDYQARLSLFR